MYDWDAIRDLGAYLGLDMNVDGTSSGPDGGRLLGPILRSKGAFSKKYPEEIAEFIFMTALGTDLSCLPRGDGDREKALSCDVFRRVTARLKPGETFEDFDPAFRKFIGWFRAALEGVACVHGLRAEAVSLGSPDPKGRLTELRGLPFRRPGERYFPGGKEAMAGLPGRVPGLLEKYEGRVISPENCRGIAEIMGRLSSHSGYVRTMDTVSRLEAVRPLLLAFSELQLYPVEEPEKADLLSALSMLLFNVFPTPKLLRFVARFEPGPENDALSYDHHALLALGFMLSGNAEAAADHNEKASGFAADDEKRAYTYILDGCIRLSREDIAGAVKSLRRCSLLTADVRMRTMARFYLGTVYYGTGDVAGALGCFEQCRGGLEEDLDAMGIYSNIGTCAMLQGDLKAAAKAFSHVDEIGRRTSDSAAKALKAIAYGGLGIIRFSLGEYDRSMGHFKAALRLARDARDRKGAADQLGNIGLALKMKRDYSRGLEYFKSMLSVSSGDGYFEGVHFALGQIGQLLALEGRYEEIEAFRQDAIRRNPGIAEMLKK